MFFLRRPDEGAVERFLVRQAGTEYSYPEVGATRREPPPGYAVDRNRVRLGSGEEAFRKAAAALRRWEMFRLGWVALFPAGAPIEPGTCVAVRVNHFGFWSLNAARVVYRFDEPRRFGFAYGTLTGHAEQGEERFSVEWTDDDSVFYDILAFSKPRHWAARLGKPVSRALQKRFARDSKAAMVRFTRPGAA